MAPGRCEKTELKDLTSICQLYIPLQGNTQKVAKCQELASQCKNSANATSDEACRQLGLLLGGRSVASSTSQFQKPSGISDALWKEATDIHDQLKRDKAPVSKKRNVPYDYDIWFHGGCGGRDLGFKQETPTTVTIDPQGNIYFSIYSENEVFLYPGTRDAAYKSEFKYSLSRKYLYDASKGNDNFIECARKMKDPFVEATFLARDMIKKEQKTFAYLGGDTIKAEGLSFQKDGEELKIWESDSPNKFSLNNRGLFIENDYLGTEDWAKIIYRRLCSTTPSLEASQRICWVFEEGGITLYDPTAQKENRPLSLTRVKFQRDGETQPVSGPYIIE